MQNSRGTQPFQVTRVWARNFRSIADAVVDLDRLTVLVGPNASGKSNILDILRFIKDAFRFDLEAAISLRHGMEAIQHRTAADQAADVELGLAVSEEEGKSGNYSLVYGFTLASDQEGGFRVRQEYAKVWHKPREESVEFRIEEGNLITPAWMTSDAYRLRSLPDEDSGDFGTSDLWLPRMARLWRFRGRSGSEERDRVLRQVSRVLDLFHRRLQDMRFYHIFPNTIREPQKLGNVYPLDEDAGNLASVLRNIERRGLGWLPHFKDSLQHLIPGVLDLEVTAAGGYLVVRLKHEALPDGAWIDLSQESDGTIRLLGLLVALYQRRHLPLIGIEEPELTVHPGALAVLANLLNEAARRSQVIVTTHSPELIDYLSDFRAIESLRIVELREGVTVIGKVASTQIEAVRQSLFSLGELHRMGELELSREDAHA